MKKYLSLAVKTFPFMSVIIFFSGCVKDTCKHAFSYTLYLPVYKTTAEVRADIKSNPAREIKQAAQALVIKK
jgi:hypothetical protein